jgi:serine protease Do
MEIMNMVKTMNQTEKYSSSWCKTYPLVMIAWLVISCVALPVSAEDQASIQALKQIGKAFASIAEKASPAVVGVEAIKVQEKVVSPHGRGYGSPYNNEDLYEYFFGPRSPRSRTPQRPRETEAQGTGFIISKDGYILTNNHVVSNAKNDKVTIKLSDGTEVQAKVVGTDPESDVAVVKIDTDDDMPFLTLADSDALEVGEWVVAIGSPFGLSHTVTAGIVSAKGRTNIIDGISFEDFIQTDAAINPGNSGGPLLNLDAEVVGINTAIMAPGGANAGIGFAIPTSLAKNVAEQLMESGKVVRGYLGVLIENVTPGHVETLDLEGLKGALITEVNKETPAAKAGLEHYDVIVELDGDSVESANDLMSKVAALKPETKVRLKVMRDGRSKKITVILGERPANGEVTSDLSTTSDIAERIGVEVTDLTEELSKRFGFEKLDGVLISVVNNGSEADRKGLRAGMLILEVNRQVVESKREFNTLLDEAAEEGKSTILLYVTDGSRKAMIPVKIPDKED